MAQVADESQKPMVAMAAAALQQSAGKDKLTVTVTAVPRGVSTRLELEEGLLRLIATAGQMAAPMMMPGGPGGPGDAMGPGAEPPAPMGSPATEQSLRTPCPRRPMPRLPMPPAADAPAPTGRAPAADADPFR